MDIDKAKALKVEAERQILVILREFSEATGMAVDTVRLTECHQLGEAAPRVVAVSISAWLYP